MFYLLKGVWTSFRHPHEVLNFTQVLNFTFTCKVSLVKNFDTLFFNSWGIWTERSPNSIPPQNVCSTHRCFTPQITGDYSSKNAHLPIKKTNMILYTSSSQCSSKLQQKEVHKSSHRWTMSTFLQVWIPYLDGWTSSDICSFNKYLPTCVGYNDLFNC